MWRNYLTIAYRSLKKNKTISLINVIGLGIAWAACLVIWQFAAFEFSYDKFHSNSDHIYRVTHDRYQQNGQRRHSTNSYPAIGPAMMEDYDEVISYSRLLVPGGKSVVKANENFFHGDQCLFVDNNFLSIFDFPLVIGDKNAILSQKRVAILTEEMAKKYFPELPLDMIIDKEMLWGNERQPYVIKGIARNVPENSHLQFDVLLSYTSLYNPEYRLFDDSWTYASVRNYLLLKPTADHSKLEGNFEGFSARHFEGSKVTGSDEKLSLQPLHDIHLFSDYEYEYAKTSNGKAVWIMLFVAIIILVTASINYTNLTALKSFDRGKEVGIRKVMGAQRAQLIKQFITESLVLSLLAIILGLIIVQFSQPYLNNVLQSDISFWHIFSLEGTYMAFILPLGVLLTVIISGFYPAFILSSHRPVKVLRGKFTRTTKGKFLRKSLVIFQFMALSVLGITTLIVARQLKLMTTADLGIDIENTLIISPPMRSDFDSVYSERVRTFKHAVTQLPQVTSVATSSYIPGSAPFRTTNIHLVGDADVTDYTLNQLVVDEDFFTTYDVELLEGRPFESTDWTFDWDKIDKMIVNRSAAELLKGSVSRVIGEKLTIGDKTWTIIGVIEDFHQQSLHAAIEPAIFNPDYGTFNPTSVKLKGEDYQNAIGQVKKAFDESFPDNAFNYYFLEDYYNRQYAEDRMLNQVINIFTALTVIIACLGLIGLSSYTAMHRMKEIGIRKALGATVTNIMSLLTIDFVKLIMVATLLALPIAYFAGEKWLTNYAYRITPGIAVFAIPIIIIIGLAIITISSQVFKASKTNPVDTLRHE